MGCGILSGASTGRIESEKSGSPSGRGGSPRTDDVNMNKPAEGKLKENSLYSYRNAKKEENKNQASNWSGAWGSQW